MTNQNLSTRFKNFAMKECKGSSDLYEFLSLKISEDTDIIELCKEARPGQPISNLLFGAVHFLLLKGIDHQLKEYYPSLTEVPRQFDGEIFTHFKEFCTEFREEIITLLKTRLVQTNEVRRCAYLFPIFSFIHNKAKKPLSLIEIGTSAGLQLNWDKYSYSYGTDEHYGNKNSTVHITSQIIGGTDLSFYPTIPPVASRVGIDLHVSDLTNDEDYLWLKSLIWPEHRDRRVLFEKAASCFMKNQVELVEGDGVALLEKIVDTLPKDTAICIFHTHVANQMPDVTKVDLLSKVKKVGSKRDVFHLYNNIWDSKLHLDYYLDGVEYHQTIGDTDGHGRWFDLVSW
ncbi:MULTISPECIES: DUF2332 domain-containing protein [Bacillaceae]|uniref:DUF2332 domain-containing protein n=1 Tax=Evansella alkalicola TaxID=745819 RepID=A0ABS6JVY3_9BACI|nr:MULTISPECIES: DUF2332 domain-containing protein [Bacillaceae]MBU9722753.1 DUF2332 domain-containing protein [Bacillus alkalicola]